MLIVVSVLGFFGLGSVLVGICCQIADKIIWPMVEFILHLFGVM